MTPRRRGLRGLEWIAVAVVVAGVSSVAYKGIETALNNRALAQMNGPDGFHNYYYDQKVWEHTTWLGVPIEKLPLDLFVFQEILYETRPDVIVEAGTFKGGSAYFFAS